MIVSTQRSPKKFSAEILMNILAQTANLRRIDVQPESELIKDLSLDSLDMMDIIVQLENEYDIFIPENDIDKLVTVRDLLNAAQRFKGAKPANTPNTPSLPKATIISPAPKTR